MPLLIKNNAYSLLAAGILAGDTSLTVTAGTGERFPIATGGNFFFVTLQDAANNIEIVKVTNRVSLSDSMTIVRAQEGTTARAWNLGDIIELRLTAGIAAPLRALELDAPGTTLTALTEFVASGVFKATAAGNQISVSGAGSLFTVNPATSGSMNNVTIGATVAQPATVTNLAYTGTLTGGTGIVNIGSGQIYKDALGNVGIGTNAPEKPLHVVGPQNGTNETNSTVFIGANAINQMRMYHGLNNTGKYGYIGAYEVGVAYRDLVLNPNGGNLGLGVTPSAWGSPARALQANASSFYAFGNSSASVAHNVYFDGSLERYITTGNATRFTQSLGTFSWNTSPSGTAGAPISFTQAMTLTQGGSLLVGTTADNGNARIHAGGITQNSNGLNITYGGVGSALIRIVDGNALTFGLDGAAGNTERARITAAGNLLVGSTIDGGYRLTVNGPTNGAPLQALAILTTLDQNVNLVFNTTTGNGAIGITGNALVFKNGADTERARITSAGNLLVGTTVETANRQLHVGGSGIAKISTGPLPNGTSLGYIAGTGVPDFYVSNDQNGAIILGTNSTERARITSGGNFRPGADNAYSLGEAAFRWSVVFAATGTINTSDERAKFDFQPTLGLDFITALEPTSYRYKSGKTVIEQVEDGVEEVPAVLDDDGNEIEPATTRPKFKSIERVVEGVRRHHGLKAQQVKQVLDQYNVDFAGWVLTDPTNPDSEQGLRYDQFIAPLIQAVKELAARLDALESLNG